MPPAKPKIPLGRIDYVIVALLLILGVFQIATFQAIESYGSDASIYIVLAHNIRAIGHYEFNFSPHTVYPPGFPLILAGIAFFTGREGYDVFVRFMPAFGTLALIVWYFVLRRVDGRAVAGSCCLLAASTAPMYQLVTRNVLSDAPFFFFSGLALLLLMTSENRTGWVRYGLLTLFCLTPALTVLVRIVGLAVCAALLAWAATSLWFRKLEQSPSRSAAIAAGIVGLAAFGWWTGWTRQVEHRNYKTDYMVSYASQLTAVDPHRPELGSANLRDFAARMMSNLPVQAAHLAELATRAPYVMPAWYSPLTVIVVALLACGLASCVADNLASLLGWYFLACFSIYLLWPFDEGQRFMLPVAPLAFALMWRGIRLLVRLLRAHPHATFAAISLLAACLGIATAMTGRQPGLQAHAAVLFWPFIAVTTGLLAFLAKRAAPHYAFARPARTGVAAGVAALVIAGIFQQAASAKANLAPDPSSFQHHASADFSAWLREAPPGVVMAQQSAIVHRLSGRRIVDFPITSDPRIIARVVDQEMVRYVVVNDRIQYEYFFPVEEDRWRLVETAYPAKFHLAHRGPGYRVFEVARSGQ